MEFRWRLRRKTTRIIVHSSHFGSEALNQTALLRARGREMGLLEIGYHFVIERDGTVNECRPRKTVGSHTPGNNHDSIGVCLAGDRDHTPVQTDALVGLLACLQVGFGPLAIHGHTELQRYRNRERRCPVLDMEAVRRLTATHLEDVELSDAMNHEAAAEPATSEFTPQQQLVLDYLKAGRTLTTKVAVVSLGIMSVSSRIAELRKLGQTITEEWAEDHFGKRYLKYRLNEMEPVG